MEPPPTSSRHLAPLPAGTTLLHIGPPKTGTTALQDAASSQRDELASLGVLYPGARQNHRLAALELMERHAAGFAASATGTVHADRLTAEIASGSHHRVFLSSETFGMATTAEAERVLDKLGGPVHVLLGLRDLAGYALSMWQQRIKAGDPTSLDDWIAGAMATPGQLRLPGVDVFSERDGHDLITRWAELVGPANVTVVVLDKDRRLLFDVVEDLLDLPRATLTAHDSNASLTAVESGLLREMSRGGLAAGMSRSDLRRIMLGGVSRALVRERTAPRDEPRATLSAMAVDHLGAYGRRLASAAASTGVGVIGDLEVLGRPPQAVREGAMPASSRVPTDLVRAAFLGIVSKAQPASSLDGTVTSPAPLRLPPARIASPARWRSPRSLIRDTVVVIDPRRLPSILVDDVPAALPVPGQSRTVVVWPAARGAAVEGLVHARRRIARVVLVVDEPHDALALEWGRHTAAEGAPDYADLMHTARHAPETTGMVSAATIDACVGAVGHDRVTTVGRAGVDAALGAPGGWYDAAATGGSRATRVQDPGEAAFAATFSSDRVVAEGELRETHRRVLTGAWRHAVARPSSEERGTAFVRQGTSDGTGSVPLEFAAALLTGALIEASRGAITDASR